MTGDQFDGASARAIRTQWFRYLDAIEPQRAALHAYCRRLTGNVWDAEDLVQETLLKGFAMSARGDLHGEHSPVRNIRAYLIRSATNLWLDTRRRARWFETSAREPSAFDADPSESAEAVERAVALTSAREFAAFVMKELFDFTLEEIADFIGTTTGTVKSALSRARTKLARATQAEASESDKAVARAFAEALSAHDVDRLVAIMAESIQIDVCNVGGGRGRHGVWTGKTVAGIDARYHEYQHEPCILLYNPGDGRIEDVLRIQSDRGRVTRLIDYCYAPETLVEVAASVGADAVTAGYHQPGQVLVEMIATTGLPWHAAQ